MWPSWWKGEIRKNGNAFKRLSVTFKRFPNAFERVCCFPLFPLFTRKVTYYYITRTFLSFTRLTGFTADGRIKLFLLCCGIRRVTSCCTSYFPFQRAVEARCSLLRVQSHSNPQGKSFDRALEKWDWSPSHYHSTDNRQLTTQQIITRKEWLFRCSSRFTFLGVVMGFSFQAFKTNLRNAVFRSN